MGPGKDNFKKASDKCQQWGGFLVEPKSEEMSTAVKSFNFKSKHLWIGLKGNTKDRTFLWQTNKAALSYTDWADGQPNNLKGKESCVALNSDYRWDDIKCELKLEYLCQAHKG